MSENNKSPIFMPIAISAIAILGFTTLLHQSRIGEVSYCFLVALSALLGIVLHGFSRLQELDLKNLRLVLREIRATKEELFVREAKLKAIALPLAQIIALSGASEGRVNTREVWKVKREWYRQKLQALVETLELSSSESIEVQKYLRKFEEIDQIVGQRDVLRTSDPDYDQVKQIMGELRSELLEMMKADLHK